tara:strand:- start:30 stop:389 length:360 start_codon:yes stop_codon:yes gene_type:complete
MLVMVVVVLMLYKEKRMELFLNCFDNPGEQMCEDADKHICYQGNRLVCGDKPINQSEMDALRQYMISPTTSYETKDQFLQYLNRGQRKNFRRWLRQKGFNSFSDWMGDNTNMKTVNEGD